MTLISLTDTQIERLLQGLAAANPEYGAFAQQYAALGERPVAADQARALARDLLAALRESPQQAARLDAMSLTMALGAPAGGSVAVPLLLAAAFLLRSHIRLKRRGDGSWDPVLAQPTDGERLTLVATRLAALLADRPADPAGS